MISGRVLVRYINLPMSLLYDVGSDKASPFFVEGHFEKFIGVEIGVEANMLVSCRRSITYFR